MFGFDLSSSGGELAIGGVNRLRIKGDVNSVFQWNDVIQPAGFWAIKVGSFKSSKSDQELGSGRSLIIDSGTTGIVLDLDTVQAFYSDPAAVDLHALDSDNWSEGEKPVRCHRPDSHSIVALTTPGHYAVPCDGTYTGTFGERTRAFVT